MPIGEECEQYIMYYNCMIRCNKAGSHPDECEGSLDIGDASELFVKWIRRPISKSSWAEIQEDVPPTMWRV